MERLSFSPRTALPAVVLLFCICIPAHASPRDELLAIHQQDRKAHLTGNADLIAAHLADVLLESNDGAVARRTREEVRNFFAGYFSRVRYSKWDDVVPPEVRISQDGRMAWMLVSIEAHILAKDNQGQERPRAFVSSWIATYEKQGEHWRMVAIASSVKMKET